MHRLRFAAAALLALAPRAQEWQPPRPEDVRASARGDASLLACTAAELAALRAAYDAGEPAVSSVVEAAERALAVELVFPPRGGQHNQWYQCDACQLGLETVDATHHRCPRCERVYSGPPYDDVVFSRVHGRNLARARNAAWAFALTGERRFADDARAVLLGYAERYESYPYHANAKNPTRYRDSGGHLKEQTLTEASWLVVHIAPAYDLIAAALEPDERRRIEEHLVLPLVRNVAKCRRGKSNWQTYHNAAMFAGGILLGDDAWMRRALFDPKHGLLFQLEHSVTPDGMWYENSWGYHAYTLRALVEHVEAARRCGIDLWGSPVLRAMCTAPVAYVMPDGMLPRLGDDTGVTLARMRDVLEPAWAATRDPAIAAVLPADASWESILYGRDTSGTPAALASRVFRGAGHAILRAPEAAAVLSFGPHGGFHGHFDKLSFVWYARGRELGVDPGRAKSQAYRLPIHTRWYRATLGHNAVVVDGRSQAAAAGRLLAFVEGEGWAAAAARCDDAYEGVAHARCLVLFEDCLVVLDALDGGGEPHRFDWVYHGRGGAVDCDALSRDAAAELRIDGGEFVDVHASGEVDAAVAARFPGKRGSTLLRLAAAPGTTIRIGDGPGASVLDRVPLLVATRLGAAGRFAAVLEATPRDGGESIDDVAATDHEAGVELRIRRRGGELRVVWDGRGEVAVVE